MAKKKTGDPPRDLTCAGALCLAYVNTTSPRRDDRRRDGKAPPPTRFTTYSDLLIWGQRMGALGSVESEQLTTAAAARPAAAVAVVKSAVELRNALMRVFTALAVKKAEIEPRMEDLAVLNQALRPRGVFPSGDGFRRDWGEDSEALDRVLWPVAHSAAELLTSDRIDKIRQCGTKGCFRLFIYANRRRIWCDPNSCGNRAKGRRRYEYWQRIRNRRR